MRHRITERRRRPDGKYDIVAVFFNGIWEGSDCEILDEIVVHEKVGPRQATALIDRLDEALAAAYIQGRANQDTKQHGDRAIPEKVAR